jgi:hypothetical protein
VSINKSSATSECSEQCSHNWSTFSMGKYDEDTAKSWPQPLKMLSLIKLIKKVDMRNLNQITSINTSIIYDIMSTWSVHGANNHVRCRSSL